MTSVGSKTNSEFQAQSDCSQLFEPTFIDAFINNHSEQLLGDLLIDRTASRNIIWADNEYEAYGPEYSGDAEITLDKITRANAELIKPRVRKDLEKQSRRTRDRAEVFTPSWLCNQMNNDMDGIWFGRRDVFNTEHDQSWQSSPKGPIQFPRGRGWQRYVKSKRLEITCGEAPFVCSRYDTVTGHPIPVPDRIGILDRKLRVVTQCAKSKKQWIRWALAAVKASYGFEYQGDNLLIARINVVETLCEHYQYVWQEKLSGDPLLEIVDVVTSNFWQMNGFTDAVPTNKFEADFESLQGSYSNSSRTEVLRLFNEPEDLPADGSVEQVSDTVPLCMIVDWAVGSSIEFSRLKKKGCPVDKKFYAVIGNPPYQEESAGEKISDAAIYQYFMDAAYEVSDKVELITPARFLFNNGNTSSVWNQKMLDDPHFKVLKYVPDASTLFPNVGFKGGVAIHLRDLSQKFGAIVTFTAFEELNSIRKKVVNHEDFTSITEIIFNQNKFNLEQLYKDYPELKGVISSNGRERRLTSGCIDYECFHDAPSENDVQILGVRKNKRIFRYLDRKYIETENCNLFGYKVIVPANNGSGAIGEVLSTPLIGDPLIGYTQTFIAFGNFDSKSLAENAFKYIKSKFARTMLGVLKVTQNGKKPMWKYVPLQDFTDQSDIDWSKPVADIDRQLYAKYGLSDDEIAFIESHVKEMD